MQTHKWIEKTYSNRYLRTGLHGLFWTFIFASGYYFNSISFNPYRGTDLAWLIPLKNTTLLAAFYYPLTYYILPRLFIEKKWVTGVIATLVLLVLYAFGDSLADQYSLYHFPNYASVLQKSSITYFNYLRQPLLNIVLSRLLSLGIVYQLIIFLSMPIAVKAGRSYFRQSIEQLQLAKDNLQLEFNFLKAQVNPHFLFNTLNNIYSLVEHDRKIEATTTISRLSGFMRATLYDSNEEQAPLEKEVQLLSDYIDLEKLRLNETRISLQFDIDKPGYTIPPLLLMPAVENCFKYADDNHPDSYITIEIKAVENQLTVRMENRFDEQKTGGDGGIGLANMKKRLQHYYPDLHSFSSGLKGHIYITELTCQLL